MSTRTHTRTSTRHTRIRAGLAFAIAGLAMVVAGMAPAGAGPTADGPTAAGYGAGWLARQQAADGSQPGGFNAFLDTADAALAFSAAEVADGAFADAVAHLVDHVDEWVAGGGNDDPGGLGKLLMVATVAGVDPNSFGSEDLEARLLATLGDREPGLFGSASPTFDGAFRQSLALLGLAASGRATADFAAAIDWLVDQQCPSGAWQAYRADTSAPCGTSFSGPDSNSTGLAAQALVALGAAPAVDLSGWLADNRNSDGGYGYVPGSPSDANSTALGLQALAALGDPTAGTLAALLGFQLGCDAAEADRGAFAYQPGEGGALEANTLATLQAVVAAAGAVYPLAPGTRSAAEPVVPCNTGGTTTTTSTTAGAAATTSTTGAVGSESTQRGSNTSRGGTRTQVAATGPVTDGRLALAGLALLLLGAALLAGAARRPQTR